MTAAPYLVLRRRRISGSGGGGGAWSPVGKTGVVAAWDMETVYQEAALSTAAADTDPIGGVPDLTGNGNILSNTGSARPVRASGSGLFWADFDGATDYFALTLPTGQRKSDMTLMIAVSMSATEADFVMLSSSDGSNNPYVALGIDGGGAGMASGSGAPTIHIDDGAAIANNRDTLRDSLVAAGACLLEARNFDMTTSSWVNFGTSPSLWNYRSGQFVSDHNMYRGILVDNATISAEDLASARTWAATGAGVTL